MDNKMHEALGQLICALNPYTDLPKSGTPGDNFSVPGEYTGDMDPFHGDPDIKNAEFEVETHYPGGWTFKGQEQKVVKALRIRYRYPVQDKDKKTLYYVTDYLLVGYEGGAG